MADNSANNFHSDGRILVVDFGSQYTLLIARRLREVGVFSSVIPFNKLSAELLDESVKGIILSGGPKSTTQQNAPRIDDFVLNSGLPILGICYGQQALACALGGQVKPAEARGYGSGNLEITQDSILFDGVWSKGDCPSVWLSHGDQVSKLPDDFEILAQAKSAPLAAIANKERSYYGVQFHPEVVHTPDGIEVIKNFALKICGSTQNWSMGNFRDQIVQRIREQVGKRTVLCALSGGVDSAVTAALLLEAVPTQVKCIMVDTGLLRIDEAKLVSDIFKSHFGVDLVVANEGKRFLTALAGVSDPEKKRKIIGHNFIEVFEEYANTIGGADLLAQGTLYPDVIESVSYHGGPSQTIKSHHNVGGLPERMNMELIEPLRALFKDEVRLLGKELGLPASFLSRHPFPGPGLAIRIPEEVSAEKVAILQAADQIYIDEIINAGLYNDIWQAFAVLLPVKSVGVMGDQRTWNWVISLRAVSATDGMTAKVFPFDHELLQKIATRIVNEVMGVNRVLYDCTSKPPATIEWE